MMKKWICIALAFLTMCACVLPAAAVNKVVNNDIKSEKPFFLDDCEDASGWSANGEVKVSLDEEEASEGGASIRFTTDLKAHSNATIYLRGTFSPEYVKDADFITFDFYTSHPDVVNAAFQSTVSIGSDGLGSNRKMEWQAIMFMQEYVEGWNTVTLPLNGAQSQSADMTEIDNFQLLFQQINTTQDMPDLTLRIDNIRVHTYGSKAIMFNNCDTAEHWSSVDAIENQNHKEGEGALVFYAQPVTVPDANFHIIRQFTLPTPINAANADYFEFDMYVSDPAALRPSNSKYGLNVEITSSGTCDREEYSWGSELYVDGLKTGWNHIKLPISGAAICEGAPNMKALNFFRMHLLELKSCKDDQLVIMIDNMYLSVTQDGIDDYAQPEPEPEPDPEPNPDPGQTDYDPWPGGELPEENVDAMAARKAVTARRARSLAVIFVFIIIGVNVIVVAFMRKQEEWCAAADSGEAVPEMLQPLASDEIAPKAEEVLTEPADQAAASDEPTEN